MKTKNINVVDGGLFSVVLMLLDEEMCVRLHHCLGCHSHFRSRCSLLRLTGPPPQRWSEGLPTLSRRTSLATPQVGGLSLSGLSLSGLSLSGLFCWTLNFRGLTSYKYNITLSKCIESEDLHTTFALDDHGPRSTQLCTKFFPLNALKCWIIIDQPCSFTVWILS